MSKKVTDKMKTQWSEDIIEKMIDKGVVIAIGELEDELELLSDRISFVKRMLEKVKDKNGQLSEESKSAVDGVNGSC